MTTGQRMKALRKELNLSAEHVAEKLGVSAATIYRYENGDIEKIPGDRLGALASILCTSPAYLMGWSNQSIPAGFYPVPETERVPLLGSIACGEPILAEENIDDYIDVPGNRKIDFCLICSGDSMIDAGIHDGDIVYIRQQPDVENGEIAAVRIGSEATLKRIYKQDGFVTLIAENKKYPPYVYKEGYPEDVVIVGKAIGFQHWY